MYACRYTITDDAGNGHLVLGKSGKYEQLSSEEKEALSHVFSDDGCSVIVYHRLLLHGVVYTNSSYKQSSTSNCTLAFVDDKIEMAMKYVSCSSSEHFVLVQEYDTTNGPVRHIKILGNKR